MKDLILQPDGRCVLVLMALTWYVPDAFAQPLEITEARYAATITIEDLRRHLTILASDAFEGRDTGKEGQKMAAAYIKEQFIAQGIPPLSMAHGDRVRDGYYQPFALVEERSGSISLVSGDRTLTFLDDLLYFAENLKEDLPVKQLIYMRDGSNWEVKGVELNGQVAMISESGQGNGIALLGKLRAHSEAAARVGVKALLVATPRLAQLVEEMGHYVGGSRMRLAGDEAPKPRNNAVQIILVDQGPMNALLARNKPGKLARKKAGYQMPVDFTLRYTPNSLRVESENVLAYIEGSDKKDELVVLTAHYDHIGVENGEVYNGADDDGSGTVALIEIAEAFARAKAEGHGPRRSVLVMPVSGEEKGLLGSRYYSEHPVFPLENTLCNLNIDMIGRVDSMHANAPPYVYIIGSDRLSTDLHLINEEANQTWTKLDLDYTFNAPEDPNKFYYRSDHYNFARKGVPAIFYFSGVHEDYHQPGDEVDKIMFDLLHQRTLLVFHAAWSLANRDQRIVVDGKVE
jgi:hypothetical protein